MVQSMAWKPGMLPWFLINKKPGYQKWFNPATTKRYYIKKSGLDT